MPRLTLVLGSCCGVQMLKRKKERGSYNRANADGEAHVFVLSSTSTNMHLRTRHWVVDSVSSTALTRGDVLIALCHVYPASSDHGIG